MIKCSHPSGAVSFLQYHLASTQRHFANLEPTTRQTPQEIYGPFKRVRKVASVVGTIHDDASRALAILDGRSDATSHDVEDKGSIRRLAALAKLNDAQRQLAILRLRALQAQCKKAVDDFNLAMPDLHERIGLCMFESAAKGLLIAFEDLNGYRKILPSEFARCVPENYRLGPESLELVKEEVAKAWNLHAQSEAHREAEILKARKQEAKQRRISNVRNALRGIGGGQ